MHAVNPLPRHITDLVKQKPAQSARVETRSPRGNPRSHSAGRTSTGQNQPGSQTKQGVASSDDDCKSDILGVPIERHIQPDLQFVHFQILYFQAELADEHGMKK